MTDAHFKNLKKKYLLCHDILASIIYEIEHDRQMRYRKPQVIHTGEGVRCEWCGALAEFNGKIWECPGCGEDATKYNEDREER